MSTRKFCTSGNTLPGGSDASVACAGWHLIPNTQRETRAAPRSCHAASGDGSVMVFRRTRERENENEDEESTLPTTPYSFNALCERAWCKINTLPPCLAYSKHQLCWNLDSFGKLSSVDFNSIQNDTPLPQPWTSGIPCMVELSILVKYIFFKCLRSLTKSFDSRFLNAILYRTAYYWGGWSAQI